VCRAQHSTRVLYPRPEAPAEASAAAAAAAKGEPAAAATSARPALTTVAEELGKGIRALGQLASEEGGEGAGAERKPSMLSDALSSALCHVNRFAPAKATAKGTALRPRLLASPPPTLTCGPFQWQSMGLSRLPLYRL